MDDYYLCKAYLPIVLNFEIAKIVETTDGLSTKNAHFYIYLVGAISFRHTLI